MSGRIPQAFIDDLLARVDIVQVIEPRVPLKKAGGEYKACCPFHNEKTPSFTVSPSKQFYHCFGCGAHGSAIGFVMEYDRLDFVEAIESLAKDLGLEVPREGGSPESQRPSLAPMQALLKRCAKLFQQQLQREARARTYLQGRGLDQATTEAFGLGYAPDEWNWLMSQFPAQEQRLLEEAGMVSRNERGRTYDRFRGRLMFPITDRRGEVIAFGGRTLDDQGPKYLNSPETPLFHKGRELYGLHRALHGGPRPQRLLVVEGYMDVIALSSQGVPGVVATLGTATTDEHLQILYRQVAEVVFCFDGDAAGGRAALKALDVALPHLLPGREARFLFLPQGEDPDSLVRSEGGERFAARIARAQPLADFLFQSLCDNLDLATEAGRAALVEKFRPLDARLPKSIYAGLLRDRLAELTRVARRDIDAALGGPAGRPPVPLQQRRRSNSRSVGMTNMRQVIALLLKYPEFAARIPEDDLLLRADEPGVPLLRQLLTLCRQQPPPSSGALLECFRGSQEERIIGRLFAWQPPSDDTTSNEQVFGDALAGLRRRSLRLRREALISLSRQRPLADEEKQELQRLFADSGSND